MPGTGELWAVLDEHGRDTGRTHERGFPLAPGDYHLIVDVWIRNGEGLYLISRRAVDKHPFAGMWAPTCGCAIVGDTSVVAAAREASEELGVALVPGEGKLITRIVDAQYQDILDVWLFEREVDIRLIVLQPGETDDAAWASMPEIREMMSQGQFMGPERIGYLDML